MRVSPDRVSDDVLRHHDEYQAKFELDRSSEVKAPVQPAESSQMNHITQLLSQISLNLAASQMSSVSQNFSSEPADLSLNKSPPVKSAETSSFSKKPEKKSEKKTEKKTEKKAKNSCKSEDKTKPPTKPDVEEKKVVSQTEEIHPELTKKK